ncbi:hypothetical protein ABY45_06565 [Microbacterium maritypicum]|uniref:hypothetical protein n=1 Tax=Microbacterium TaxID=33882 RepID=UPI001F571AB8|nr:MULTISPECIES: hypothetical protein [Microbacterium]MDT0180654.1 hypothetical protein [Microbacterium sp. ARD31]
MSGSWRTNDTVAYDKMQERHTMLTHLLVNSARSAADPDAAAGLRAEMIRWKDDTLAVDGYDRQAIDTHAARIETRIQELSARAI